MSNWTDAETHHDACGNEGIPGETPEPCWSNAEVDKFAARIGLIPETKAVEILASVSDHNLARIIKRYAEISHEKFSKSSRFLFPPSYEVIEDSAWEVLGKGRTRHYEE